ncbi:hypothetical protein VOLCADRAFT_116519 [Volvox carteri f. nagariensis]|uniref:Uncharacterized protein n=1 Tax=Volvox carteri f. nagariensis TaxID=3068 RepID=D8TMR4_VOLCA|nr:uncharacterized protein VOLCADRAFT_116519 [Volvox carteri f. nagariensis]EFJ51172.1 hypothetical protein VOLCADRAFT_116519 [Volvox carteri f. nagariensis]|eukprot:XP_002947639.1 hypothetical protein VOLCADRAFT_116519 [Volvox carteri f. nagariensis]
MLSPHTSQQPHLTRRATHAVTFASRGSSARAPAGDAPWRSVLGPESRLPNVFWGAVSPGSLRRMSYYTALPPVELLVLAGEATYSRLKDALGLRDQTASRVVGGPQPPYVPPPSPLGAADGQRSETEALQLNEAARLQYNAAMGTAEGESAPLEECFEGIGARGTKGMKAESGRSWAGRPSGGGSGGGVRGRSRSAVEGGGGGAAEADEEEGWSRADRRRISELAALAVGAAGAVRMRLLWGTLQEAAAVATLATLYPDSQLEEVGLLCLSDPRKWGVEPHELPPLGASPDALITHNVLITRRDVEAARAELMRSTAAVNSQQVILGQQGSRGAAASQTMREAAHGVARAVLRAALVRHTQPALSLPATTTGTNIPTATSTILGTCSSSGSDGSNGGGAVGGGGATRLAPSATTHPQYRGASSSPFTTTGTRSSGDGIRTLPMRPPVGSSRDAPPPLFACGWDAALDWLVTELLRLRYDGVGTEDDGHAAGPLACRARGLDTVMAVVQLREVVEVKNHCPFVSKSQRKARKRGLVIDYVVRDRGPISSVWPLWVPQLQAHMACSGADSALLLSRSPSRGVRLFRMFRDDAYIEAAFDILRELQCSHVARRQPPGCDPWVGRAGYEDFVQRTVAVSFEAETIVTTSATPKLPGADYAAFWDMR